MNEITCFPDKTTDANLSRLHPSISFPKRPGFLKNWWISVKNSVKSPEYKISCVAGKEISLDLEKRLKEFEQRISYSYDGKNLIMEHGRNSLEGYNGFFNTLGKSYFYIAECKKDKEITKIVNGERKAFLRKKGEIAAIICYILRTLKAPNGSSIKAWYVCNLKVDENHRGENLAKKLIKKSIWHLLQHRRGFGICKDESNGQMSKAAEISTQQSILSRVLKTTSFNLYKLNAEQATEHYGKIEEVFRKHGYMDKKENLVFLSNEGLKDYQIIDKKTGINHSLQLLHAVPSSKEQGMPKKGYDHMISAVKDSAFDKDLKEIIGYEPSSTARFVSCNMGNFDFNQITSKEAF